MSSIEQDILVVVRREFIHHSSEKKDEAWDPSPSAKEAIERTWRDFIKERDISENATLLRVLSYQENSVVTAPDVTYKDVVGMRRAEDGEFSGDDYFQVLTAFAHIRTKEGRLLLLERDQGDWAHSLELPGGFMRAAHTYDTLAQFLKHRVERDTWIPMSMMEDITFAGWYDRKDIFELIGVFDINLSVSIENIKELGNPAIHIMPEGFSPEVYSNEGAIELHPPSREWLISARED